VVEQVLSADSERTSLLAREAQLLAELEAKAEEEEDDEAWWPSTLAELGKVSAEVEASGAATAEPRVRRLLAGLGFTTEMAEVCS